MAAPLKTHVQQGISILSPSVQITVIFNRNNLILLCENIFRLGNREYVLGIAIRRGLGGQPIACSFECSQCPLGAN